MPQACSSTCDMMAYVPIGPAPMKGPGQMLAAAAML